MATEAGNFDLPRDEMATGKDDFVLGRDKMAKEGVNFCLTRDKMAMEANSPYATKDIAVRRTTSRLFAIDTCISDDGPCSMPDLVGLGDFVKTRSRQSFYHKVVVNGHHRFIFAVGARHDLYNSINSSIFQCESQCEHDGRYLCARGSSHDSCKCPQCCNIHARDIDEMSLHLDRDDDCSLSLDADDYSLSLDADDYSPSLDADD